jgi:hypothetical protein
MSEWMKLDLASLDKGRTERIHGVMVHLLASPHNVPEAVRGFYDKAKERFVIEFRYLDEEDTVKKTANAETCLFVGKNSSRLYRIELDVRALKAKEVGLLVSAPQSAMEGIQYLKQHQQSLSIERNYDVADTVIEREKGKLFQPLHA